METKWVVIMIIACITAVVIPDAIKQYMAGSVKIACYYAQAEAAKQKMEIQSCIVDNSK